MSDVKIGPSYSGLSDGAQHIYFTMAFSKGRSCSAAMFGGHTLDEWAVAVRQDHDFLYLSYVLLRSVGFFCPKHLMEQFLTQALPRYGLDYFAFKVRGEAFEIFKWFSIAVPLPLSTGLGAMLGTAGGLMGTAMENLMFEAAEDFEAPKYREAMARLRQDAPSMFSEWASRLKGCRLDASRAMEALTEDGIL